MAILDIEVRLTVPQNPTDFLPSGVEEEKITGERQDNRPELQKILNDLQEGDIIYVTDLTRITRSHKIYLPYLIQFEIRKPI